MSLYLPLSPPDGVWPSDFRSASPTGCWDLGFSGSCDYASGGGFRSATSVGAGQKELQRPDESGGASGLGRGDQVQGKHDSSLTAARPALFLLGRSRGLG